MRQAIVMRTSHWRSGGGIGTRQNAMWTPREHNDLVALGTYRLVLSVRIDSHPREQICISIRVNTFKVSSQRVFCNIPSHASHTQYNLPMFFIKRPSQQAFSLQMMYMNPTVKRFHTGVATPGSLTET